MVIQSGAGNKVALERTKEKTTMIMVKINETGEFTALEMIDEMYEVDWVVDFIGNNGGFGDHGIKLDDTGQYSGSAYTVEWWQRVISDHVFLAARMQELRLQHGWDAVIDATKDCFDCDLEDQAKAASDALDKAFGPQVHHAAR